MPIRQLREDDVEQCVGIVRLLWGDRVANQAQEELCEAFGLARWPPHYYVVEEEGRILGFAGLKSAWLMSNVYEFVWINVHPDAQGRGLGKALTEIRIQEVDHRGGSLIMLMTKKPTFFEQFGFRGVETVDGWVLMLKQISPLILGNRT